LALATSVGAQTCDSQHGIWARDTDQGRWIAHVADQLYPPA